MNSIEGSLHGSSSTHLLRFQSEKAAAALQGWKNIASYLDRGVRTVQRWERDLGLPVYRVGKGPRCPVFAFSEELHSWLRKSGDLRFCTDSSVASSLLGQERSVRIANPVRKTELVENGQRNSRRRKTPKVGNLQAIINLFGVESSAHLSGDCEQCHSPLRSLEGYFSISETERSWVMTIRFCPVCDQETIGGLAARQCLNSRESKLHSTTPMQA